MASTAYVHPVHKKSPEWGARGQISLLGKLRSINKHWEETRRTNLFALVILTGAFQLSSKFLKKTENFIFEHHKGTFRATQLFYYRAAQSFGSNGLFFTIASIASTTSALNFSSTSNAFTLSNNCSILDAPSITVETFGFFKHQASAK